MRLTVKELEKDLQKGNDINIYISDRAGWKSTTCQLFLIEQALKGYPFILLRSKIDEVINENWLSEHTRAEIQNRKLSCHSEKISNYISMLYLSDGEKKYPLCYGLYVSVAKKYKSNYYKGFEEVKFIVWEECVPSIPLVQNIRYCTEKYFEEIKSVFSIGSTVSRGNKIQYIFLGNDISSNIINSVTVGFNMLERLKINERIEDTAEIDGTTYTFLFLYFDFPGAVNHWLNDLDREISQDIPIENKPCFPYIILTEYNRYYLYNCGKHLYISSQKHKGIENYIRNEQEFFEQYGAEHLLNKFNLSTALNILVSFYPAIYRDVTKYFGEHWERNSNLKFNQLKKMSESSIINISELVKMKYAQIYNLPNYNDILTFNALLKENTVIYENIAIKLKCEELKTLLLLV